MAHGDYTGTRKAQLAQQYAQQQRLASQQTTLVSQVVEEGRQDIIDLMTPEDYEALNRSTADESNEENVVQIQGQNRLYQPVKFRASDTVEQITVGKDRVINLEEGQGYAAPRWLVLHLDEKQLVRH